ncbi:hypothetical protein CQW23_12592 [Capsicum baccatum]|uniref:GAG-pre-integrase domain-containing protein n=1 Tax=Capsicum baccatum TaxID=33114 RepID=A0A2G2WT23_CAPBA|nr:hypothetical protein CQW23_12592 [Capsicum baccatum]
MLNKPPYPTFTQFVNALREVEMREDVDEEETPTSFDPSMAFMAQKSQGLGCQNYYRGRGQQRGRGGRWDYSYQSQQEVPQELALMAISDQKDNNLYMDSGATNHMVQSIGDKRIGKNLHLKDMFVVLELKKNLIFVSKLVKDNAFSLEFTDEGFVVKDKSTGIILSKGHKRRGMYALGRNLYEVLTTTRVKANSDTIWHQRLGHPHSRILSFLHSNKMIDVKSWNKSLQFVLVVSGVKVDLSNCRIKGNSNH